MILTEDSGFYDYHAPQSVLLQRFILYLRSKVDGEFARNPPAPHSAGNLNQLTGDITTAGIYDEINLVRETYMKNVNDQFKEI